MYDLATPGGDMDDSHYYPHIEQGVPREGREVVKWYRKAAEQGLSDAQFNLGLMYVEGHSTLQDFVRAHMWLNIAAATSSGDDSGEAVMLRGFAASQMTSAQIEQAQEMARRCQQSEFKECN
jgi:TPR repeat protein